MNEPGIDLTGKLIIKVALGDDIRRILITNEDITYDELVLMMQRVYRGKLNSTDDIVIKYKDEDNDLITIFDSSDLSFAIQCSRILKITLFVNSKPEPLQTDEIKMIKSELKHIRDRCTKLLDRLDERVVQDIPSSTVDSTTNKGPTSNVTDSPRRQAAPSPRMPAPTNTVGSKEFDPLSRQRSMEDHQDKVMSSFGLTNDDRAGTPDSISSIGSAGQRQGGSITPQAPSQAPPQPTPQGPPQHSQQPPQSQQQQQPQQPQQPVQQTGMYPGTQKMSPWQQQQNQQQNASGQPSFQGGQQQGFPASSQQQGFPGQQPPVSQQPQTLPTSASGSSYGPGGAQYSSYSQPGQGVSGMYGGQTPHGQFPGQQPGQSGPTGQTGHPGQHPQQQQQQQPPQSYYQQQPQQPGGPGQMPPPGPGGNPYARQGPGYSSGYPRPTANYPQGYQ